MSDQQHEAAPLVSLQSGPREPGAGVHIASGVLLGSDLAVFPLPRHVDLSSDVRLHVLVSPVAPAEDDVVERILPRQVDITSLQAAPQERVALVRLASPSRYGSGSADPAELTARLVPFLDRPDLPQALHDAGVLGTQPVGRGLERALADVLRIEVAQSRRLISHRLGRHPVEISAGLLRPGADRPVLTDPFDGLALAPG